MIKTVITFLLIALFAQISFDINGFEVSITLQTVAITGLPLVWRKEALIGILLYLILGALGLPIFSDQTGGIEVFQSSSGGFLWGFVICAITLYNFQPKRKNILNPLLLMLLGHMVIIASGILFILLIIDGNFSTLQFITKFGPAIPIKLGLGLVLIAFIQKIEQLVK